MKKLLSLTALLVLWGLVLSGCTKTDEPNVGLANPASVYCEENGGTLEIESSEAWDVWICMFEDGSYCEEWSYYRNECVEGDIFYNTISDEEIPTTVLSYTEEDLLAAENVIRDYIANEFKVKVEVQKVEYLGDDKSAEELVYCKSFEENADSPIDECVVFSSDFYIPEQDAEMAWGFEPDSTIQGYQWYLGRSGSGEWKVLTFGF